METTRLQKLESDSELLKSQEKIDHLLKELEDSKAKVRYQTELRTK
jgi:hypothetical protein